MLRFHLITGIIFLYLYCRLIVPFSPGRKTKTIAAATLLILSQQHFFLRFFFGGMPSPELPAIALLLLSWSFISFILLAFFFLISDLASLLCMLGRKSGLQLSLPFSPAKRAALLLVLSLALAAYGEMEAVRVPDTRTEEITLDRLPQALDGLTLVHISDPHASALFQKARMRAIVDKAMAFKPDLIVLTGDLVDGTPARRADDVAPLRDLRARYGVFACAGNHEYYANYAGWMSSFRKLGLSMLSNSHSLILVQGEPVVIAGVTDPASSAYGLPGPDIETALAGAPKEALTILLAHQPRNAPDNARFGVDLQLSGHTHGGQILGLHLLVKQLNNGFVSGWYSISHGRDAGRMRLYVNRGAGLWSGFPVRLGVPAEITRIVLRAPKNKAG